MPETIIRNGRGISYGGSAEVDTLDAPETLDEEYRMYETTPIIHAAIAQHADDSTGCGHRATADSDDAEEWLNETFLPRAGIVGGERHKDFGGILKQSVVQYFGYGTLLCENVKNDHEQLTGFLAIRPPSVKLVTEDRRPILLDPDGGEEGAPMTPRGEQAAFLQYHNGSILGQKGEFENRPVVPLSQNDVTKKSRNPGAGDIWGVPVTRPIKDRVTALKQKLKDNERAIRTKAYGIWGIGFNTETIETADRFIVEEWEDDEQRDFVSGLENKIGPGGLFGHDGSIDIEQFEGSVADGLLNYVKFDIQWIISALPSPMYAIGFANDINQFVVKRQEERYEKRIEATRKMLEQTWTPALKQACRDHGFDDSGVELHVEPEDDDSPVRSLDDDDITKFQNYAKGLKDLFGSKPYTAFDDAESFGNLVAQLPEEALRDDLFDTAVQAGASGPGSMPTFNQDEGMGGGSDLGTLGSLDGGDGDDLGEDQLTPATGDSDGGEL